MTLPEQITVFRDTRPSFTDFYLDIALTASRRGDCIRSQVGAVIVTTDHIAIPGYNGTKEHGQPGCLMGACPRGRLTYDERPSTSDYTDCIALHAEANALKKALLAIPDKVPGSSIYVTRAPCSDCMTLLVSAGVTGVFYIQDGWGDGD